MKYLNALVDLLFPPKCCSCGELVQPGANFCYDCSQQWKTWLAHRCAKCGLPAPHCSCAPHSRRNKPMDRLTYTFFYNSKDTECPANRMIYTLKRVRDRRLTAFLGTWMARSLQSFARSRGILLSAYTITYPPRSRRAVRQYGFDHTALLARALGRELSLPVVKALDRRGNRVQKKLTVRERAENAAASYRLSRSVTDLDGEKMILVDDVITSGATLSACEALLYKAGARDVILCTLAKDI